MERPQPVRVRAFGVLQSAWRDRGLPAEASVDVPDKGVPARDLAERLGLPLTRIEGVFVNHVIHDLGETVRPGDDVAFVPHGTPGPHRFFLGLYEAGSTERKRSGA